MAVESYFAVTVWPETVLVVKDSLPLCPLSLQNWFRVALLLMMGTLMCVAPSKYGYSLRTVLASPGLIALFDFQVWVSSDLRTMGGFNGSLANAVEEYITMSEMRNRRHLPEYRTNRRSR